MVYSGKIYETDGANPVAVHEADAVRPLAPIPHSPSFRIFRTDLVGLDDDGEERYLRSEPRFFYGNPGALAGASQLVNLPEFATEISVLPMLAAIIVSDAFRVDLEDADDLILGYTMVNMLFSRSDERLDRSLGAIGHSHDFGGVIGPVLTTPDELEDSVETAEFGRHYGLTTILRVNGVERQRGTTNDIPFTFAQAISFASQTCTLKTGDIIAIGPVVEASELPVNLEPGDEVHLAIEKLGALSLKLNNSQ